jgi:hypothetical protein
LKTESDPSYWAELDESSCPCGGSGWASRKSEYVNCPIHYNGQLHPETQALLLDEPLKLQEEERRSRLQYRVRQSQEKIAELKAELRQEEYNLQYLQLELVKRTPTIKMKAISPDIALEMKPKTLELDLDLEEI